MTKNSFTKFTIMSFYLLFFMGTFLIFAILYSDMHTDLVLNALPSDDITPDIHGRITYTWGLGDPHFVTCENGQIFDMNLPIGTSGEIDSAQRFCARQTSIVTPSTSIPN